MVFFLRFGLKVLKGSTFNGSSFRFSSFNHAGLKEQYRKTSCKIPTQLSSQRPQEFVPLEPSSSGVRGEPKTQPPPKNVASVPAPIIIGEVIVNGSVSSVRAAVATGLATAAAKKRQNPTCSVPLPLNPKL